MSVLAVAAVVVAVGAGYGIRRGQPVRSSDLVAVVFGVGPR